MNHAELSQTSRTRFAALDLLRVLAFSLLILYHCGMYYVSWGWHVKSPRIVTGLEQWMQLSNPWRMPLLFFISGAVLAVVLSRTERLGPLAWRRTKLLMAPLLMGLFITVLPQAYMEAREKLQYGGTLWEFALRYWAFDRSFCHAKGCMPLPTWNHLWFLPYVWSYSLLLIGLVVLGAWRMRDGPGRDGGWMPRAGEWLLGGYRLLWLPVLWFALLRNSLFPYFPSSHDWIHDPYNHALYGSAFLLAAAIFAQPNAQRMQLMWLSIHRLRWWALAGAVAAIVLHWVVNHGLKLQNLEPWALAAIRSNSGARQWLPIVAFLGFAHAFCERRPSVASSSWLRYLSGMVFCAYVLHQTLIVVMAPNLAALKMPIGFEASLLVAITALGCWLGYELIKRVRLLHIWFGVRG
jgi:glucans biosynthesis protein C